MELDHAFEAKDELAHSIRDSLQQTMSNYGYSIIQVWGEIDAMDRRRCM